MARNSHRHRRGGDHEHENDERWLLTYSDMITLLMALFMVLFSISSVNISKYRTLQQALRAAFSGNILPGGKSIAQPGATANSSRAPSQTDVQSIVPLTSLASPDLESTPSNEASRSAAASAHVSSAANLNAAQREQESFEHLKHQVEAYARQHGFASSVNTTIERRGLVIRVLTDSLLFPSGSSALEPRGEPLLREVAGLLQADQVHPVSVIGNTDNVPIHTSAFPSNWELSTARADAVVRFLIANGVDEQRMTAAGYAELHPLASNETSEGRARNRRVEIVLERLH